MNNQDIINEVRNKNNIIDVISSYIPLTKKGKNYFGVCPFHDDTNPSMSVSEEKQIYKCFSCGAAGNVFNFVMDYEQVDFKEALNILAKKVGIKTNNITSTKPSRYEKYYQMYEIASMLYQNNLNSKLGLLAKDYLYQRKIDDKAIKKFKIGLSLTDKNMLTKLLLAKDYTINELNNYGLSNNENDLYINRIMFPLTDINGNTVGFSGRIYNSSSDSKYINTKETNIFKKGNLLYNYYNAKEASRLKKHLIITEGFMDVIRLSTIGIDNAIALMGTSITKEQETLIKRLSSDIYLSLDGDPPGRKASFVVGERLKAIGLDVKVVNLTDNLDPDEYIIKYGKDKFNLLLENASSLSDYKINYLKEGRKLTSIDEETAYINEVINEVAKEKDSIKQELLLNKISIEFNINIEILKNKLQNVLKSSKIETLKKETPKKKEKLDKYTKASNMIILLVLNSYDAAKEYESTLNYLPEKTSRYLMSEIMYYYKVNGSLLIADFLTTLTDKKELLDKLKDLLASDVNVSNESITDYIKVIKDYNKLEEIKLLKAKMEKEPDPLKQAVIADQIKKLKMGA